MEIILQRQIPSEGKRNEYKSMAFYVIMADKEKGQEKEIHGKM